MFFLNQNISANYYCVKSLFNRQKLLLNVRYFSDTKQCHRKTICDSCGGLRLNQSNNNRYYLIGGEVINHRRYLSSDANNEDNTKNKIANNSQKIGSNVAKVSTNTANAGIMIPVKHMEELRDLKQRLETESQRSPIDPSKRRHGFIVNLILKKPYELIEWYEKTPPKRRVNYYISYGIKVYYYFAIIAMTLIAAVLVTIGTNPITGRDCIISVPIEVEQMLEGETLVDIMKNYAQYIVPSTDDRLKRLDNVFNRLMSANNDIEGIGGESQWVASLIDDPNVYGVIVLKETKTIVVFNKVLEMCDNDHQLAYVLAHTFAHSMLDHKKESSAYTPWYWTPLAILLPRIYRNLNNNNHKLDFVDQGFIDMLKWVVKRILTVAVIPYSKVYEQEADRIGLQLLTRACFDMRESYTFCRKNLEYSSSVRISVKKEGNDVDKKNYFYLHPIDKKRVQYLYEVMPSFFDIRHDLTDCGKLC